MKAHKAVNTTSVPLLTICICSYIHMVIGHMKAHKAINTTYCTIADYAYVLISTSMVIGHMKAHKSTYQYDICTIADYAYVLISTW